MTKKRWTDQIQEEGLLPDGPDDPLLRQQPGATWKTEFSLNYAVPAEIEDLVSEGVLEDTSWHNDAAPSFRIVESGPDGREDTCYLFVEHPDPTKRELYGPRYRVFYRGSDDTALETESLKEVLEYINDHWKGP